MQCLSDEDCAVDNADLVCEQSICVVEEVQVVEREFDCPAAGPFEGALGFSIASFPLPRPLEGGLVIQQCSNADLPCVGPFATVPVDIEAGEAPPIQISAEDVIPGFHFRTVGTTRTSLRFVSTGLLQRTLEDPGDLLELVSTNGSDLGLVAAASGLAVEPGLGHIWVRADPCPYKFRDGFDLSGLVFEVDRVGPMTEIGYLADSGLPSDDGQTSAIGDGFVLNLPSGFYMVSAHRAESDTVLLRADVVVVEDAVSFVDVVQDQ